MGKGGNIYRRGEVLWMWWWSAPDASGKRRREYDSTTLRVGQERAARELLRKKLAKVAAGDDAPDGSLESFYRTTWWPARKVSGKSSVADDDARMREHVLPLLGSRQLDSLRVHDVLAVSQAMLGKDYASRTIHNTVGVLKVVLRDAVRRGLLSTNPCNDLGRGDLPVVADKDPEWREGAVLSLVESDALINDLRIPLWRRVDYAVGILTGARDGERFFLRLKHIKGERAPLAELTFAGSYNAKLRIEKPTKTGVVRRVPIHPALGAILSEWLESGWAAYMGRPPTPDDLLLPVVREVVKKSVAADPFRRNPRLTWGWLQEDLAMLGFRARRAHDFRATTISLAVEAGAHEGIMKSLTHPRPREAFALYKRFSWEAVCAEVAKLPIRYGPGDNPGDSPEATARESNPRGRRVGDDATGISSLTRGSSRDSKQPQRTGTVTTVTAPGSREWVLLDQFYAAFLKEEAKA